MHKKVGINIRELYEQKLKEARARFAFMEQKETEHQPNTADKVKEFESPSKNDLNLDKLNDRRNLGINQKQQSQQQLKDISEITMPSPLNNFDHGSLDSSLKRDIKDFLGGEN